MTCQYIQVFLSHQQISIFDEDFCPLNINRKFRGIVPKNAFLS